jgi:diguanylate cyclase (GGDEF)-like protein
MFPFARELSLILESWYYFFSGFMPFMWLIYTETKLSNNSKAAHRRIRWMATLLALYTGVLIWNVKSGWVFTISEQNVYQRGEGYVISAVIAYIYLSYATIRTLLKASRHKWKGERRQYYSTAAFIIPPVIGGIVQMLHYGVNYIWICTVISAMMFYIDLLNRQISTETLTGLNNRRELNKYLLRETREGPRSDVLALIMMDIDAFKEVNDTFGHYYGDGVLITVSDILKKSCKNTSAFLARIGGDEFCIVLPADDIESIESLIEKIQYNIIAWNTSHRDMAQISLSIGYSVWDPTKDKNYETLYKRADQNMYKAKRAKKLTA